MPEANQKLRNWFRHTGLELVPNGQNQTESFYTMVETAKANKANVYYYLKYILEQIPSHMEDTDTSFLKAMVPWSEEYREYERVNTCGITPETAPEIYDSKPRTPRKGGSSDNASENVA